MKKATNRQRIAVVTGTRAEYGLLKPIMQAIKKERRLRLQVIATGMHLLREFGHTLRQIEEDGWAIDARVRMQTGTDDRMDRTQGLARGVAGIGKALARLRSDTVLVLGDRIEPLAGALAGMTLGKTVAHIHGGDVAPGDVDDAIRHAVTKLAHIHFAATKESARRIRRLGEDPKHIHVVGAPGLDDLRRLKPIPRKSLARVHGIDATADLALVVQHPIGRPASKEKTDMLDTLQAVGNVGLLPVIVYPNSDPGYKGIVQAICQWERRHECAVFASLPREVYLSVLMHARVLVGNSSSGIIETAMAGTPAVDVGPRQLGRLPCGTSVLRCGYGTRAVQRALRKAIRLRIRPRGTGTYGSGYASEKIAGILAATRLDIDQRRKHIGY